MTEKDVWKWLLPNLDDETIYTIYKDKSIICNGFRVNSAKDIKAKRRLPINNLTNNQNFPKLKKWIQKTPIHLLENEMLDNKEVNEIASIATEVGTVAVIGKLLHESDEPKVIQFYSFLRDHHPELLEVDNKAFFNFKEGATKTIIQKEEGERNESNNSKLTIESKNEDKKINKLLAKIEDLKAELETRDKTHKNNLNDMKKNISSLQQKLDERNLAFDKLTKENDLIVSNFKNEKAEWEKEKALYDEKVDDLQKNMNDLHAKLLNAATAGDNEIQGETNIDVQPNATNNQRVLVMGKPAYTQYFEIEGIEFEFVDGNIFHEYNFPTDYDDYWVLLYELSVKEQVLLKANTTYTDIEQSVTICKDFNDVNTKINEYTNDKVRV